MATLLRRLSVLNALLTALLLPCAAFAAEGRFISETLHSKTLEGNLLEDSPDRSVLVYLPPSYDSSPDRRYPVVYLLHGWTMHSLDWIGREGWGNQFDISEALDAFMTANPTRELIVVMPDAFNKYLGSWYTNSPVTGNWEDFLTQELVAHTDATYRTLPERAHRGIAGYSMGGAGAWRIATRYPELYDALYDLDGGLTGDALTFTQSRRAWQAILAGTADATTNPLELGTGAAFSPNPNNPPYYIDAPYEMLGDSLVYLEAIAERWVHAYDVVDMLRLHPASLPQLRAVRFGYSKGDGPKSARIIAQTLARLGIAHVMEEYEGAHIEYLATRVETRLLPFMARALHGELPKVRSAHLDLGVVEVGHSLPEVSVVLGAPPEATGTFPELSLDLSSLGVVDPLPMHHDGKGRYTFDGTIIPPSNGRFRLPVYLHSEGEVPYLFYEVALEVYPAEEQTLFTDGLTSGWQATTSNNVTLDPQATAQVFAGNTSLGVQASSNSFALRFLPPEPVEGFGYTLRFAFHPGEATGGSLPSFKLALRGKDVLTAVTKKLNGVNVDLEKKEWQVAEVPLQEMFLGEPARTIELSGTLKGTFYLDDIRLVPQAAPQPTAVEEERTAALPQSFTLAQNFPNPFNSSTVIRFALPASGEVELAVFNLAGQRVARLAEGVREAGSYTLRWDGQDEGGRELASGVYLYRLRSGEQLETRKLALVR